MNAKSLFLVLVIVIVVGRCKKKDKKMTSLSRPLPREKINLHRKCLKTKSEEIRHSQNQISSAVFSSKCKKQSHFLD